MKTAQASVFSPMTQTTCLGQRAVFHRLGAASGDWEAGVWATLEKKPRELLCGLEVPGTEERLRMTQGHLRQGDGGMQGDDASPFPLDPGSSQVLCPTFSHTLQVAT